MLRRGATRREAMPRGPAALLVAGLMVRHWAATAQVPARRLVLTALGAAAAVSALTYATLSRLEPADLQGLGAEPALFAICLALFHIAWGFGIFLARAGVAVPAALGHLRFLPLGRRSLLLGVRLPAVAVGLLVMLALGPAATHVVGMLAGYGLIHAVTVLVVLSIMGAAVGSLTYAGASRWVPGTAGASLRLTTAAIGWVVGAAVSVVAVQSVLLQSVGGGFAPLWTLGPLLWPLVLWLALSAAPEAYLVCSGLAVGLVLLAAVVAPPLDESVVRTPRPLRRAFDPRPPLLLARLEVLRLWRNLRTREALVVGAFFATLVTAAGAWLGARPGVTVDLTSLALLASEVSCAAGALSRALSARECPVERRWGYRPAAHVLALVAATATVGALLSTPATVVLLGGGAPWTVVPLVLGATVLFSCTAVLVSVVLVPALGVGSSELAATLSHFVLSAVTVSVLVRLGWPDYLPAGVLAAGLMLLLAVLVEQARQSGATGHRIGDPTGSARGALPPAGPDDRARSASRGPHSLTSAEN